MPRLLKKVAPEKDKIIDEGSQDRTAELHGTEQELPAQNSSVSPSDPFNLERQDVSEINDDIGKKVGKGEEKRGVQHPIGKPRSEEKCRHGGSYHPHQVKKIELECSPNLLESIANPNQEKDKEGGIEPIRSGNKAAYLRNENVS